jgi:hypothetical protein
MAKQTINLGTGELTGDGESIRSAFDKINNNFDELYTTDSSDVVLSAINASLIPDTDVAYDLGSATNRFRDLYLSGSTIDLGGTTLSIVGGNLQVGGTDIKDVVASAGLTGQESATGDGGEIRITGGTSTDTENFGFGGSVVIQAGENPNANQQDGGINIGTDHTNGVTIGAYDFGNGFGTTVNISGVRNNIGEPGGRSTTYLRGTIDFSDATVSELNVDLTGDFQGSVFADDSTLLVDAVNGKIVGDIETDSLTIGGTGFVNFNNDAFDDTYRGGFTTDKSILQINGANYLAGSDDGGGVIISGGMARNGGNNGDVIIASGGGGADNTGYISLLSAYITASGTWIGTQTMDIKGSVFGDDSTLLVDGVNGVIPASVLDGDTTLGIIEASQLVAGTDQSISLGYKDFNGDGHSLITLSETNQIRIWGDVSVPNPAGTTIDFNGATVTGLNVVSQGLTYFAPGGGGSTQVGLDADVFDFGTGNTIDMQNCSVLFTGATISGLTGNLDGDVTGSVFGDDSTLLVDGVNGKIVGPYDNGVVSINPTNVTTYDIFVQQDANTHDLYVANKIYGGETGAETTLVIGSTTTIESDVNFNDVVKFAKTTTTGADDNPTLTLIDVNSSGVQVLTSNNNTTNNWELPDGSEGQIMHFVAGGAGGSGANHKIKINNWWKRDGDTGGWSSVSGYWDVFAIYGFSGRADTGMATAIFVDGAWRTTSPWVD